MDRTAAAAPRGRTPDSPLPPRRPPSQSSATAFPPHPPQDQDAFDLEKLPPREFRTWKTLFLRFVRQLTFKDSRRLILKSPTHSCRIKTLLELFPDARFVHIVRDPYVVFPSTVNLWKTLYLTHGLQTPTFAGLEQYAFHTFTHLYHKLYEAHLPPPPG